MENDEKVILDELSEPEPKAPQEFKVHILIERVNTETEQRITIIDISFKENLFTNIIAMLYNAKTKVLYFFKNLFRRNK